MRAPSRRQVRTLWRGNFAAILRGNVINSLLGLTAGLVLAKVLEPDGRGLLAIALAWSGIALVVFGLGLRNAAAFFAARYPDRHGEVLRASLQVAAASTVVILAVGITATTVFVDDETELYTALLVAFSATPFALVTGIGRGMLNAIDLKLWSRVRLVQPGVYAGAVLLFAVSGHLTVVAGAVAYLASLVVSAGWVWWVSPTKLAPGSGTAFRALRRDLVRYGFKSSLALSAQVTNVRLDVALLGIFLPVSQVGLYAVAASLAQYIVPLSTAAAPWVFPRIARGAPTARSWAEAQRAVRLTVALAGGMAVAVGAVAPVLLGRVLGPEWLPALVPLWILLVGAVMQAVRFTQVSIASAYNRPELTAYSEALAAVVTVVALWPMVELLGVYGAAIVSVMAYTTGALLLRRGIIRAVRDGVERAR